MKRMLPTLLALSFLSMQLDAALRIKPHPYTPYRHHPYRRHQPSQIVKSISRIPWRTVAAGGVAVSGVIFAYKVADGIQQGTVEAARSSPETFLKNGTDIIATVKTTVLIGVVVMVIVFGWRLARNSKPPV